MEVDNFFNSDNIVDVGVLTEASEIKVISNSIIDLGKSIIIATKGMMKYSKQNKNALPKNSSKLILFISKFVTKSMSSKVKLNEDPQVCLTENPALIASLVLQVGMLGVKGSVTMAGLAIKGAAKSAAFLAPKIAKGAWSISKPMGKFIIDKGPGAASATAKGLGTAAGSVGRGFLWLMRHGVTGLFNKLAGIFVVVLVGIELIIASWNYLFGSFGEMDHVYSRVGKFFSNRMSDISSGIKTIIKDVVSDVGDDIESRIGDGISKGVKPIKDEMTKANREIQNLKQTVDNLSPGKAVDSVISKNKEFYGHMYRSIGDKFDKAISWMTGMDPSKSLGELNFTQAAFYVLISTGVVAGISLAAFYLTKKVKSLLLNKFMNTDNIVEERKVNAQQKELLKQILTIKDAPKEMKDQAKLVLAKKTV